LRKLKKLLPLTLPSIVKPKEVWPRQRKELTSMSRLMQSARHVDVQLLLDPCKLWTGAKIQNFTPLMPFVVQD